MKAHWRALKSPLKSPLKCKWATISLLSYSIYVVEGKSQLFLFYFLSVVAKSDIRWKARCMSTSNFWASMYDIVIISICIKFYLRHFIGQLNCHMVIWRMMCYCNQKIRCTLGNNRHSLVPHHDNVNIKLIIYGIL